MSQKLVMRPHHLTRGPSNPQLTAGVVRRLRQPLQMLIYKPSSSWTQLAGGTHLTVLLLHSGDALILRSGRCGPLPAPRPALVLPIPAHPSDMCFSRALRAGGCHT